MEFNPLDIDDFTSVPSGPILTVTRVGWRPDLRRGRRPDDAGSGYGSRPIRDGLKIRYGVTWLPLLWLPFMVQPTVVGVWEFQD